MTQDPKNLARTRRLRTDEAAHLKHPMHPTSEIFVYGLNESAGMQRQYLNIARIPPGKESFLPHSHTFREDWVFAVEGHGIAIVNDDEVATGPDDFLGFPAVGTTHHLKNTTEELDLSLWLATD